VLVTSEGTPGHLRHFQAALLFSTGKHPIIFAILPLRIAVTGKALAQLSAVPFRISTFALHRNVAV
jgi:hypothetical protein